MPREEGVSPFLFQRHLRENEVSFTARHLGGRVRAMLCTLCANWGQNGGAPKGGMSRHRLVFDAAQREDCARVLSDLPKGEEEADPVLLGFHAVS
jgi:hypothetical protein